MQSKPDVGVGWTTVKMLTCKAGQCGRCSECGNGHLPSENRVRALEEHALLEEEERIADEEAVRISELEKTLEEEQKKCAAAVQRADEMEHLKQEAEGKVEHLETKVLEAEEEALSLKLKLGEGGDEVQSELDKVMLLQAALPRVRAPVCRAAR